MTDKERIEKAKSKAKDSSKELFKKKSKEAQDEFEKETTLGKPENLIKPDNENE